MKKHQVGMISSSWRGGVVSKLIYPVGRTNRGGFPSLPKSIDTERGLTTRGFSSTCIGKKGREIKLHNFLKDVKKASDEEEMEVDLVKQFKENKNVIVEEKPIIKETKKKVFDKTFDEMFNEGENYLEKRILHKATEAFSDCIEMRPNNYLPYLQRSKTYLLKGEHTLALRDMDKCMEILSEYPDNDITKQSKIDILHNRAVYYFEHEKYSEAEKNYYECVGIYDSIEHKNVQIKKVFSETLNNLGYLLLERSAAEEALDIFRKSLEIRQSEVELSSEKEISKIYFNIARAYEKSANFENSIEFTTKFLETNPENYSANLLLAKSLNKVGRFDKSIEACDNCYNILQKISTDDLGKTEMKRHKKSISFVLLLKGNNYLEKNDIDNAEKIFMLAVESNRADLQPWVEVAKLKMTFRKQYEESIFYFTSAISRFQSFDADIQNIVSVEDQITCLFCRAKCYEMINDKYSAIVDYETILRMVPDLSQEQQINKYFAVSLQIPTMCRLALLYIDTDTNRISEALKVLQDSIALAALFDPKYKVESLHHRYHIYLTLYNHTTLESYSNKAFSDVTEIINILLPIKEKGEIELDDIKILDNALYNRGVMNFKAKNFKEAHSDFSNMTNKNKDIEKLLAKCEYENGNYFIAIKRLFK